MIRRDCIVQYRVVFSFHLAKQINHPDQGWDRKVRHCSLFKGTTLSLWLREQAFAGLWTVWPCILEFEYDECKRKVMKCLFASRLSFSELFDDISLVLNVRRLCVVVDSRISAAKVCDCVISAWCWQVCGRSRCWAVVPTSFPGSSPTHPRERERVGERGCCCTRIFCVSHNNVSSVFSLADCALKNQFSTQENWV